MYDTLKKETMIYKQPLVFFFYFYFNAIGTEILTVRSEFFVEDS